MWQQLYIASFWQSHPQWRSVLAVTSRVSYLKRSEFGLKKELHADPRVVLEGNFSFRPRKYLPATFLCARPGEGFSHETCYQAEHEFARGKQAGNQQWSEGLHANKTAPMTYLIYFKTRKYVTNLYLDGTEVTRSFAAFGGSCAPGWEYSPISPSEYLTGEVVRVVCCTVRRWSEYFWLLTGRRRCGLYAHLAGCLLGCMAIKMLEIPQSVTWKHHMTHERAVSGILPYWFQLFPWERSMHLDSRGNRTPGSSRLQFIPINAHTAWQPRSIDQ